MAKLRAHWAWWLTFGALLVGSPVYAGALNTLLTPADLDSATYEQWVDGATQRITADGGPAWTVWTTNSQPGWSGHKFGVSSNPGPRHLRVGFNSAVAVGTVLALGGGRLSVLRSDVAYPGDLASEAHWIAADLLTNSAPSSRKDERYSVWVLPPGTTTRALRFSHVAELADADYSVRLGGLLLLPDRFSNIAPQATALPSISDDSADARLNDSLYEPSAYWDNGARLATASSPVVSSNNAEWVILNWPMPVTLRGLALTGRGFASGEIQTFSGAGHPREAGESSWQTLSSFAGLPSQYPRLLDVDVAEFPSNVVTRAVRVRITRALSETGIHPHLAGATSQGRRVWLGEIMALWLLGTNALESSVLPVAPVHPPIGISIPLDEPSIVTLVIENAHGVRVRNLVSETSLPAGTNIVWWDGLDESGRANEEFHGLYTVQGHLVPPGTYKVRGLRRQALDLRYQFTVNNAGQPPWFTGDGTGRWLSDHAPPSDVLALPRGSHPNVAGPAMVLSASVAEAGDGLIWTDLNGRKVGSKRWVGGTWTGASYLARDSGPQPAPGATFYTAAVWEGQLRLYTFDTNGNERQVVPYPFSQTNNAAIGGVAVFNGRVVCSLPRLNQLLFIDAKTRQVLGTASLSRPGGVAFDNQGRLLVLSSNRLLRYSLSSSSISLPSPATLISTGLEAPQRLALDAAQNVYISDLGGSHNVKVFTASGVFVRSIGANGSPAPGRYNELQMHSPSGLTVTTNGELWVAENDFAPKRVSVWTTNGVFVRAHYGPPQYGGGGVLDPADPQRFYYHDRGGMEFALDWTNGTSRVTHIYDRPSTNDIQLPFSGPVTPIHLNGVQYMANSFHLHPGGGGGVLGIWIMRDEGPAAPRISRLVSAFGRAALWPVLRSNVFTPHLPPGTFLSDPDSNVLFAWSDINGDAQVQTNEVQFRAERTAHVTINQRLQIATSAARVFSPAAFSANRVPIYDLDAGVTQLPGFFQEALGDHGGLVAYSTNGWTYTTGGPMQGMRDGRLLWSYPNQWPSLHASHSGPTEWSPGLLVGTTRLLGLTIVPGGGSDAGEMFAVNGNLGQIYLFTTDGLQVGTLFQYSRTTPSWRMPQQLPGMLLNDVSLGEECFWPAISQLSDGRVYLSAGHAHSSLTRVDGLETIRRFELPDLEITTNLLNECLAYQQSIAAQRITNSGRNHLTVIVTNAAPAFDVALSAWTNADWVNIDEYARAAVRIGGGSLYAAFQTSSYSPFTNAGGSVPLLFKSGGGFDLMIGTNPDADVNRTQPVPGDVRLLVSHVARGTSAPPAVLATLYRQRVAGGSANPVPLSSPWRTVYFDAIEDVSSVVTLTNLENRWQLSIPLSSLGLDEALVSPDITLLGDIGLLRGRDGQTYQRSYWHNESSGLTADVPSEAELSPGLWGRWRVKGNLIKPTVSLTNISAEGLYLLPTNINLLALAAAPDGPVRAVEFILSSQSTLQSLATKTNVPFACTWTNPAPGYYTLSAVAVGQSGARATSAPVHLTVVQGLRTNVVLVESNTVWRYHDLGANLSNAWRSISYDDGTWPSGPAPLGYGDADGILPRTTNSFGPDEDGKYITTYYQHAFTADSPERLSGLILSLQRDDGVVVYLNGNEVFRSNMPTGGITYTTLASSSAGDEEEIQWHSNSLPASVLRGGVNVMAAEVHQRSPSSSDIWFNLKLTAVDTAYAPVIIEAPQSHVVRAGDSLDLYAVAHGSSRLAYQWQRYGSVLPGQTNATISLTNVESSQAGEYRVIVTNGFGAATSAVAHLTVNVPPSITRHPKDAVALNGKTVVFDVSAAGTLPLRYQWQFNAIAVVDATNEVLVLPAAQPAQTGKYHVIVSNAFGVVTSSLAVLTVNVPPFISEQPTNVAVLAGETATFRVGASGSTPLALQWQFNEIDLVDATNEVLILPEAQPSQAGNYHVVVSNAFGIVTSSVAVLTVNVPPFISEQPTNFAVLAAETARFRVGAGGSVPLTFQWQFNDVDLLDATNEVLILPAAQPNQAGNYHVIVSNAFGVVTSAIAMLTVNVPPFIDVHPTNQTVFLGQTAAFAVTATGTAPLACQWHFNDAPKIDATNAMLILSNVQSNDAGSYLVVVTNDYGSTTSRVAELIITIPRIVLEIAAQERDTQLKIIGNPGITYIIEASIDFSNWVPVATNAFGGSGREFYSENWSPAQQRFYRVKAQQDGRAEPD